MLYPSSKWHLFKPAELAPFKIGAHTDTLSEFEAFDHINNVGALVAKTQLISLCRGARQPVHFSFLFRKKG
jgi:hypothetical protein